MLAIQRETRRAYCRVVRLRPGFRLLENRNSSCFFLANLMYSSTACRVCSVNSNLTGCPVFFCRTVARSTAYPFGAMSWTISATTSQPRNLLSIATLNMAKSRSRPSMCSLVRIDQTCFGRKGGFAPINFPRFQGVGVRVVGTSPSRSSMMLLPRLINEGDHHGHGSSQSGFKSSRLRQIGR
jgi:hypothetical protein